jgi:hypothetical protein
MSAVHRNNDESTLTNDGRRGKLRLHWTESKEP